MKRITHPKDEEVMDRLPTAPVFIPTSEFRRFPKVATVEKNGGKVKLQAVGKQLHGFRCTTGIIDSSITYEMCGTYEPMEWLSCLYVDIVHSSINKSPFDVYPKDFMGQMIPIPINCIALYPSEEGLFVTGGWPTLFKFHWDILPSLLCDRAYIELKAYQPLPKMIYDGSVEDLVVTECDPAEMIDKLKDLIK